MAEQERRRKTMAATAGGSASPPTRRRRTALRLAALATLTVSAAFLFLDSPSSSMDYMRKLRGTSLGRKLNSCIKTPYLLVKDVVGHMPVVVPPPLRVQPSHVTLCMEYLKRREKYGDAVGDMDEEGFTVVEDGDLCADWAAPHHSVLQIFASSLIAKVGSKYGIRYQHMCHRKLPQMNSKDVHFDYTSVQQLLMETLATDEDKSAVSDAEMVKLCKGCVNEYENGGDMPEFSYSASSQQCLLFPGSDPLEIERVQGAEGVDSSNVQAESQAALATVLNSLTEKLRIVASDHLPKTDPLDDEATEGACIYIDDTATGMSPEVYNRYIPSYIKSIQIFASASCAYAAVHNGHRCVAHGGAVRRWLNANRPDTTVRYDVVASTAASYARLIHCHKTICPPGSVGCLLPALCKVPGTTATVASASLSPNTERWYNHLAGAQIQSENMEVVGLTEEEQVMVDEEGVEFVSGAVAREGNITVGERSGGGNGTESETETGSQVFTAEGGAGMETTMGGDVLEKEFVQGMDGVEGAGQGGQQQQGQAQSNGPSITKNADGSISLAAGRSSAPPQGANEGPPPRAFESPQGSQQQQQPVQQVPPQNQAEEQQQGGAPQPVHQAPQQQEQQAGPQFVQQAPPAPQQQQQQEGGPQLVQQAPPVPQQQEQQQQHGQTQGQEQGGPQLVQQAPPAPQQQEQQQQPQTQGQQEGQGGPQPVQAAPGAEQQQQQQQESEPAPGADQGGETTAGKEESGGGQQSGSDSGGGGGVGGGGRLLARVLGSLWGSSSPSPAEPAVPSSGERQ